MLALKAVVNIQINKNELKSAFKLKKVGLWRVLTRSFVSSIGTSRFKNGDI